MGNTASAIGPQKQQPKQQERRSLSAPNLLTDCQGQYVVDRPQTQAQTGRDDIANNSFSYLSASSTLETATASTAAEHQQSSLSCSPPDKVALTTSRSFSNFGRSRRSQQQPPHLQLSTEQVGGLAAVSKTYWPVTQLERTFLPQFALGSAVQANRYRQESLLQRGAFGVVWCVRDLQSDSAAVYALKIINKSQIIQNGALAQLKNEVDIQTVCGYHPFIVQCIAYWQTHRTINILTEFVSGGELFAEFDHFSLDLVRLYVLEIAIALDFLHNAGIIYRDLKPENILLDAAGHIKLIDFGLSKWLKIGQRTRTLCGTLQYMAPELLAGQPYGHAVDWWALGVIGCRMSTDKYPTLLQTTCEGEPIGYRCEIPDPVPRIDADVRDLLGRLLQPDPQKRLRSLYSLERIALYKNYSVADVRAKKIDPKCLH